MKRFNAIGVVEVSYYSKSVVILDAMLKSSDVHIISFHKKLGGRMTHGVVAGETSAVEAAIDAAEREKQVIGPKNLKVAVCINNPHKEVLKLMSMINDLEKRKEI